MGKDKLDPTSAEKQAGSECGPGCNCDRSQISMKGKMAICLVVVIVAAIVLGNNIMQKTEAQAGQNAYAVTALAAAKEPAPALAEKTNKTNQTNNSLWGKQLESLASLNDVAAQKDAVFVYLPAKGKGGPDGLVKKEMEVAADKARSTGIMMGLYTLDEGSSDYKQVTSQASAPCVLALVKGVGSSAAIINISEDNLLQGLVTASRPTGGCSPGSSCAPGSSCSPSGCGVQSIKPTKI